jgi:hypothetical protein
LLGCLDEALIDVKNLLLLALTLALGLAARSSDEVLFLFLGNCLGVGPLLVLLAAFVGLAGFWDTRAKSGLLLLKLLQIFSVRLAVVLWLSFSGCPIGGSSIAITSQCLLLVGLGESFTGFLILEFSFTFGGTPSVSGLLLRFAANVLEKIFQIKKIGGSPSNATRMSVKVSSRATVATSSISALSTLSSWGSILLSTFASGLRTVVGTSGLTIAERC